MKIFREKITPTTSAAEPRTVELSDDDRFSTVNELAARLLAREITKEKTVVGVEVNWTVRPLFEETRPI